MNTSTTPWIPYRGAYAERGLALNLAVLLIVAGSQWGMLWLASTYLDGDRSESRLSPEALMGMVAIAFVLVTHTLSVWPRPKALRIDWAGWWLAAFLAVAAGGELLRPELRIGNVTTFVSMGAFYLIGLAAGRRMGALKPPAIPLLGALLFIHTVWYLGLLVFLLKGDLGFYGVLPDSSLTRLEFRAGYTATELPIFVGFQLPLFLYGLLASPSAMLRLWCAGLLACAFALVIASLSSAAMVAMVLVLIVFQVALRGVSWSAVGAVVGGVAMLGLGFALSAGPTEVLNSVEGKIQDFVAGDGIRAVIYGELLLNMADNPWGIGKGRFVESNTFSWVGEGVYPHHNLLGIGAELGWLAMFLYAAFVVAAVMAMARVAWGRSVAHPRALRLLVAAVLAMFLYQQFRGFFQDTWAIRETYLWLGVAVGVIASATLPRRPRPVSRLGAL